MIKTYTLTYHFGVGDEITTQIEAENPNDALWKAWEKARRSDMLRQSVSMAGEEGVARYVHPGFPAQPMEPAAGVVLSVSEAAIKYIRVAECQPIAQRAD